MNTDDMAERMFGESMGQSDSKSSSGNPAPPTPVKTTADKTMEQMAETMFGEKKVTLLPVELPPGIKELRESDTARRMYSPQKTYQAVLPDNMFDDFPDLDNVSKLSAISEFREIAADIGLAVDEVSYLRQRATELRNTPIDSVTQREDTVQALNAAFGQHAKQAWLDARALVKRDPAMVSIISSLGLGDDSRTILMLAHAAARNQKISGRLK